MFGFHFEQIAILAPLADALPFIGMLSVSELTFEEVTKILEVSIAIGIVHLLLAFFLRLHADFKGRNKLVIWTKDIPTILQYLAVVAIILAAIGSGYDIIGMFGITGVTHDEPVLVEHFFSEIGLLLILWQKCCASGNNRHRHCDDYWWYERGGTCTKAWKDEGGGMVGIIVEVIMVRIIEMLSNTISYSRLGIMLLVHSALLVTVNSSFGRREDMPY